MRIAGFFILTLSMLSGGCGGYYIMSVPDQLSSTTGSAVPVARMQRNDFFVLALAVPHVPVRFRVFPAGADTENRELGGQLRADHTDKLGYAGVKIPMAESPMNGRPGKYPLRVAMLDPEGEEVVKVVPLYVWDSNRPVVAVDLDSLPGGILYTDDDAVAAIQQMGRQANVIYLTRKDDPTMHDLHARLETMGFPDGPILQWQRQRWHITRDESRFKLPKVVIESRLVSQLEDLVQQFPRLRVGVCNNALAAKAFVNLGMKCVVVNNPWLKGSLIEHRNSWEDLVSNPVSVIEP